MPAPKERSRTFRRVHRRVPGSRTVLHYERRKPSNAKCGNCGGVLKGVPRELPYKMKNISKTKKRPERPYGGVLCSSCMRIKIIDNFRK